MQRRERSTLVGVFPDRDRAESCVDELRRVGFLDEQIGFMMQDPGRSTTGGTMADHDRHGDGDVSAGEGAITGAVTGGLVGAAAALFLPAVGPILAGGILASTLTGVAVGALTGGIAAALIDLGVPEEDARYYEGEFRSGRALVTVQTDGRYDEARTIMESYGAHFDRSSAPTAGRGFMSTDLGSTSYRDDTLPERDRGLPAEALDYGASPRYRDEPLADRTDNIERPGFGGGIAQTEEDRLREIEIERRRRSA